MKKYLSIILIFSLLITACIPRRAYAVLPLAIPAGAYYLISALLVAGGVYAADQNGMNIAINTVWNNATDAWKNEVLTVTNTAIVGSYLVTDGLYNTFRDIVNSTFHSGEQSIVSPGPSGTGVNTTTHYCNLGPWIKCLYWSVGASAWYVGYRDSAGIAVNRGMMNFGNDGTSKSRANTYMADPENIFITMPSDNAYPVVHYRPPQGGSYLTNTLMDKGKFMLVGTIWSSADILSKYNNDAVVGSGTWDWTNQKTGDRRVAAPPGLWDTNQTVKDQAATDGVSGNVGKTKEDIINGDAGITADSQQGFWDSVLSKLQGIGSWLSSISIALTGYFNTSIPLNIEPLRLVGTGFTTKFPFSLPWDIKRSFASLSGDNTFNHVIHIAVPNDKLLAGRMAFDIDLSIFDNFIPITKMIELLCFDIGLILITRKLLGGDV